MGELAYVEEKARSSGRSATPHVESAGAGRPLETDIRTTMEKHFGHDFSSVAVHTDASAARRASAFSALAFATGEHVSFAAGKYRPNNAAGRGLIAHELAHVVQQRTRRATGVQLRPPDSGLDLGDPLERDAERASRGFGDGSTMPYRQAMETLPPVPKPRPAAADLIDTRTRVLPAERAAYDDLRTFLRGLPAQIRTQLTTSNGAEPWLIQDNIYVQGALRLLDELVSELEDETMFVRFDHPTGGKTAAAYDFANNQVSLRPFTGAAERTIVAIDLCWRSLIGPKFNSCKASDIPRIAFRGVRSS